MSKYVPIGTYVPEHEAQTLEATGANDNVLSRSLRGGVYGAGSQLLSTGGAVADAVGAEDVGGYLHKQSKGLRDTAALPGNSPRVGSYAQLRDDFSMSNLGEYVGGLVGGSLPITAAGIAGGLATGGAGFVPAMLGAGAATLPFNTGEVVQRQQADPQAMQQGAGARLLDAGIGGASASAVESLVPGLVGRQLMGKGAANLAKESFKQMAGRNAMDIPLEGLTEGTGTAIKQYAANQDKPLDWNEIKEGAIGGAAAGTVFTGLGTAADAAHSVGPKTGEMLDGARTSIRTRLDAARGKAGEKLEAAGNTAPGKKVKGVFDDVSEMVDRGKKKVNDTLDKISRGEELGSPADWLAATTDEAKRRMAEFSDSERVKAVVSAGKEMMDDAGFDAAKRADLADALKNTDDRGSQMAVAAMKKAWDLSKAGAGKIKEFTDAVNSEFKAYDRRDVDVESRVVDEPTSTSELTRLGHTPADVKAAPAEPAAPTTEPAKMTIKEFSAARKAFIAKAMQDDADLSPEAAREMFNLSQNDGRVGMPKSPEPPKRSEDYSGVHKVIADAIKNNGVVERRPDLFDNDEKIGSVASTLRTLIEKMAKGNVSKGLMNKVSRLFGDDAASILNTVKNTISADLNPGEAEQFFRNMSVMKDIERGERSLHDVMRDSMTDEARTRTQEIEKDADVLKAHARGQLGGSRSEAALSDQMINEYYERNYGENADRVRAAIEQAVKPARGREEGAARMDENGAEVQDSEGGFDDQGRRLEAADRDTQVYGLTKPNVEGKSKSKLDGMAMHKDSQYAKQHMLDLRAKFSGVDTNGDYTHEVRFEQLPGSEFGHVVVEKYDNSKEFNDSDLKNMELESHEFSKSNSRIEVGGRILDAVKIARTMRGKLQGQFESGPTTAKGRLASGFKHGLSMLTDQFDQRIDVADDVVIGFVSGKKLTWGEAQRLDKRTHADKMNDADAAELFELRKEFRAAKDAGASPEVIQEILDAYKELEGETRAAKNKELGQGGDLQGRSTSRQRPMSVIEVRDAVERGKNPSSPARTREDDSVPKQIAVEYDPEDENRFMVIRDNPNGVSKDNDGSFAKDKGGNIHALGDKTGPAFGGNEANRVARAPWGSVVRQDAAQPLVNARTLAKKNEDLTTNDAIVHRSNMDGSGHFVSPSRVPHKNLIAAIAEWDSKASVGAAKLKQRAETLLAAFDMMSAADQRKFMTIAPENVKAGRGLPAVDYGSMVDYPEARAEGAVKGKFAPMSVADAHSIVNDLAVKYKEQIVAPGKTATSMVGKKGVVHQRNPVQFYNEGIAGVRGPEMRPATQPAAQPKPSINEKLVDKVVLSENYPTTVAGAEKFLNAAKKRFEALKAEDQRVLNDDDHPTQRLPEAEQKVLNALHQTFDKNSDLAPFFTELDGWDAVPEAEQIRLMKFAESLTEGKPDPKALAAKKAAFLERAASGDKALIGELKTSTDAKGLQRALESLNDHEFNTSEGSREAGNVMDVYDILNARLSELVQDPDVAYGLQTTKYSLDASSTDPNKTSGPRRRLSIEQHIEKVLGKSVRVLWQNFSHAGQYTHAYGKGLIELSVHALNPMSTAYHESLHAFFAQLRDAGAVDITNILNKAASSEHVIAQLRERFKNQPAVLTQLKDPEERAAYMYQMWASDPTFKVSIAAKNVFQKIADVIRKALGIWSNDERALHIMEFFHSGDYAKSMSQPNAMRAMIMEPGRNRVVEVAKTLTEPMRQLADAIASSGDARLRDTEIPALVNLADRIKRQDTAEGGDQGFIPAARIATTKRLGDMAAQLEGYSPETLNEALNSLQSGILAPSADAQRAVVAVKAILARTKAYMESAGVELGDLGPDYFPRVWDPHYISKNEQAMLDMLQPYVRSGQFKGNPTEFIRRLTSREGNEFGVESTKPGMQHAKVRDLAFLKAEDVAPFLNKDLMGTLASYISQAARRAEWERRLGGDKLEALKLAAQGEGATPAQMAMVDDYLKGVDGTLGDQIDPNARRLMGNMIVYQNVRLLPMAMFSMLVDPMGVMVRGGTVTDAWTTFKRGIKSIPVTYGKTDVHDEATKIAELVGVVDNAMLTSVMGDLYTQGMVGGTAKKINNAFFKYNMVEGLNRAFRVGATEAAMKFMERHMNGPQTPNSARWIAELGLRPGDIKMVGGRMALIQSDGLSPMQVTRVHAAINQWVDGSMLRPDAADKPIWMNDPHYALISHLKQFVFTFQKVILGRLVHELRHGNYAPVMALAAYVPIMIAADTAKGVIQGGGDEPEWKKGWGVEEYVGHGIQRAGLFGVGQFGVDALEDAQRGGSGFGALSGPTLEQLADMMQVMGGSKQFESVALRSMPANAVYANWSAEGAPAANLTQ